MRLFIGIEFPGEIVNELLKAQIQIRSQAKRGRFVDKANLHLTLQFLGDVPVQEIGAIEQALGKTAKSHNPFSLWLTQAGCFGDSNPYRVIWVGIGGDMQKLLCLKQDIATSLAALGILQEKKPFHPHITLGRDVDLPGEALVDRYRNCIAKSPFQVTRFSLIESLVEKGKRIYRPLYLFTLE